ncbi:MAG: hypothetical protein ACE5GX_03485 [Thermoanaerobaculia bacterium]
MNCGEFRSMLVGETASTSGASTRESLARHRATCAECARFAARHESVKRLLETPASDSPSPSPGFSARVVASLPEAESGLAWASLRLLPVTTALALTLLGWCWVATPSPGEIRTLAEQDEVLTWILEGVESVPENGESR